MRITNYILAGMIFERVTKRHVYGEVNRRILKPFKLERTIPSDRRVLPDVITGYSMPNSPFGFEGRVILDGKFIINPQMEGGPAVGLLRPPRTLRSGQSGFTRARCSRRSLGSDVDRSRCQGRPWQRRGQQVRTRCSDQTKRVGRELTDTVDGSRGTGSEVEYFPDRRIAVAVQFNTDAGRTL